MLKHACYAQAAQHWELALRVNPLHAEGWFALGYCALKRQDFARALQAFSRCAQQEPDNGDAWNNLAAIHLQVQPPLDCGIGYWAQGPGSKAAV